MVRIENTQDTLHFHVSGIMEDESCKEITDSIKLGVAAGITKVHGHLNTYGGSLAGAWDIISTIKSNNLYFTATNEGFAVSAGAVLLSASDYAEAYDYSTSMIHDPLLGVQTLEETTGSGREFLTAIKDGIMAIFLNRIKIAKDVLSDLLKKETSWNAQEQLNFGLVDEILYTSRKPKIDNRLKKLKTIYNIIEDFNSKNNLNDIIIKNMTQEEIDALVLENEMLKAKIAELESKLDESGIGIDETVTEEIPTSGETVTKEIITEPATTGDTVTEVCAPNEDQKLKNELRTLKVENFILKNKLEGKSEMIENAVKLHGVEVLNTIFAFISNDSKALENKVVELRNVITNVVNKANDSLDSIIKNTEGPNYEAMAEEIFGIGGDSAKRIELKNEKPELHEKLFNIYYNITE